MFDSRTIAANRAQLRDSHINSPYYESAEEQGWMETFWGRDSVFLPLFDHIDLTSVVELACGHGRHTAQIIERVGHATLIDINESNVSFCKKRFAGRRNVTCLVNMGRDLPLKSSQFSGLFCYDAMVHFEAMDTIAYVFETHRVLQAGGRALLHYSVNEANPEGSYADDAAWRAYFSETLMRHVAARAGFKILDRRTFEWPPGSSNPVTDGVILLEK